MMRNYAETDVLWYTSYINLTDNAEVGDMTARFREQFPYAKVTPINEFVEQTFGMIARSLSKAVYAVFIVVLLVTILITTLFLRLQMAKDRAVNAILRASGFSCMDLTLQYMIKVLFAGVIGIFIGLFVGNVLGEKIISVIFRLLNMGLAEVVFIISPIKIFIIYPILILSAIMLASILSTADLKNNNLMQMLTE